MQSITHYFHKAVLQYTLHRPAVYTYAEGEASREIPDSSDRVSLESKKSPSLSQDGGPLSHKSFRVQRLHLSTPSIFLLQ